MRKHVSEHFRPSVFVVVGTGNVFLSLDALINKAVVLGFSKGIMRRYRSVHKALLVVVVSLSVVVVVWAGAVSLFPFGGAFSFVPVQISL